MHSITAWVYLLRKPFCCPSICTQAPQKDSKSWQDSLQSISMKGMVLVYGCLDELSHDSGKIKISDLNDIWGNALSDLSGREEKLKEGIALAENYQVISSNFQ